MPGVLTLALTKLVAPDNDRFMLRSDQKHTRKYMHAETLALLTKPIVFSEHEVSKVVVMVTR
jgi:hypothetical protein